MLLSKFNGGVGGWYVTHNHGGFPFAFSFLYTVLADSSIASLPLLIACNKQDETLAKGSTIVKALLEKEL